MNTVHYQPTSWRFWRILILESDGLKDRSSGLGEIIQRCPIQDRGSALFLVKLGELGGILPDSESLKGRTLRSNSANQNRVRRPTQSDDFLLPFFDLKSTTVLLSIFALAQ